MKNEDHPVDQNDAWLVPGSVEYGVDLRFLMEMVKVTLFSSFAKESLKNMKIAIISYRKVEYTLFYHQIATLSCQTLSGTNFQA